MLDLRQLAVTGVVPPELEEARIREAWPSVARNPGIAGLGRALTGTIFLAPLAWLLMAGLYFGKLLPFLATRYTLTNRRLMIRKGWSGTPVQEVALKDIEQVHIITDANSNFFRAGNLDIVNQGKTLMTLHGIPEPDSFRIAILNACKAWVPGKADSGSFVPASAAPA